MIQIDTDKLMENQISSNSRITAIEDNNILHNFDDVDNNPNFFTESGQLEIQSKHIHRKIITLTFVT